MGRLGSRFQVSGFGCQQEMRNSWNLEPGTRNLRKIGLLGGSFNPAHDGHRHISLEALKRLGLDEVWWLVSPANPLKDPATLADYEERLRGAKAVAVHPRIKVLDIERKLGTRYTIDTVNALQRHNPGISFVWLMGADNLAGFHRWKRWREIAARVPVAVLDRAPYQHGALTGPFARTFARNRLRQEAASRLAACASPAWVYLFIRRHGASSTQMRKTLGKSLHLRHN